MMMEGSQMFRKASASTSIAVSVFGYGLFSRLETDNRVRSVGAPVLWSTEPRQECLHSSELDQVPGSGVARTRSYS